MTLDVKTFTSLYSQAQNNDMDCVAGLDTTNKLVALSNGTVWKGRQVKSTSDPQRLKQNLRAYLATQVQAVNDFNAKMGLPIRHRTVEENPTTFSTTFHQLKTLKDTEAFAYQRAEEKINQYCKNPPTTPADIKSQCEYIKEAINTCMAYTEHENSKMLMLASLMAHAYKESSNSSCPKAQQKELTSTLSGMRPAETKEGVTRQHPPLHSAEQSQSHEIHAETSRPKSASKKHPVLTIIHEFLACITQQKPVGNSHNFTPKQHLFRLKETLKNISGANSNLIDAKVATQTTLQQLTQFANKNPDHPESVTIQDLRVELSDTLQELNQKIASSKKHTPQVTTQPSSTSTLVAEPKVETETPKPWAVDPHAPKMDPNTASKVTTPIFSEQERIPPAYRPTITTYTPTAATAAPSTLLTPPPIVRTPPQKPTPNTTFTTTSSERPPAPPSVAALSIPKTISLRDFKDIQTQAYRSTSLNSQEGLVEAKAAVHHFVVAVNSADYKAGNPNDLEAFITKHKRILKGKKNDNHVKEDYAKLYKDMLNAIEQLEKRSAHYRNASPPPLDPSVRTSSRSSLKTSTTTHAPMPKALASDSDRRYLLQHLPSPLRKEQTFQFLEAFNNLKQYAKTADQKKLVTIETFCLLIQADTFNPMFADYCHRQPEHTLFNLQTTINVARGKLPASYAAEKTPSARPVVSTPPPAQPIKTPEPAPISTSAQPTEKSIPVKVTSAAPSAAKVNAPPLYNWGNTCFVNGYTNYLMLSLDQQDIAALEQLGTDTQETGTQKKLDPLVLQIRDAVLDKLGKNTQKTGTQKKLTPIELQTRDAVLAQLDTDTPKVGIHGKTDRLVRQTRDAVLEQLGTNTQKKLDPVVLKTRDAVINLWRAYRQTPPVKDVRPLQRELLCAFTRCGNAHRQGNEKIDAFFARAFPKKTEHELSQDNVSFANVRQEDVAELQNAMYDLLLTHIPQQETLLLNRTKKTKFQEQDLSLETKSEVLEGGFDMTVRDFMGQTTRSMQEGLLGLNSSFTSDEPVTWSVEEMKQAGMNNPPGYDSDLTTQIDDKFIILSNTEKFTVKIKAWHHDYTKSDPEKLVTETIDMFKADGNSLKCTVVDPITKETTPATFKPKCIVCHQGATSKSGHYFALSFQDDGTVTVHNDGNVKELSAYLKDHGRNANMSVAEFLKMQGAIPYMIDYHRAR